MSRVNCTIVTDSNGQRGINCTTVRDSPTIADFFSIIASVIALITFFVTYRAFFFKKRDIFAYLDKEDTKATSIIEHELEDLRSMVSADRVAIGTFSNGFYYGKKKIQTMTCRFEAINFNTPSIKDKIDNIDVGKFSEDLETSSPTAFTITTARSLGKRSRVERIMNIFRSDAGIIDSSPRCLRYMNRTGVDAICSRMINDGKGDIGILHIHYVKEPKDFSEVSNPLVEKKFQRIKDMIRTLVMVGSKALVERKNSGIYY